MEDLLDNLRGDLRDPEARFNLVHPVDDFAGAGTLFLRYDNKKASRRPVFVSSFVVRRTPQLFVFR